MSASDSPHVVQHEAWLPACFAALVVFAQGEGSARAGTVPDPQMPAALRALFDRPVAVSRAVIPALNPGGPNGVVRCFRYPAFIVKEVDYGEHGDDHLAVLPLAKGSLAPACRLEQGSVEHWLKSSSETYFIGAKGRFGLVQSTGGQDSAPFVIYDLADGSQIYGDEMRVGAVPSFVRVRGGSLSFAYERSVAASCSILSGGAACWSAMARSAGLPGGIAHMPPPIALCRARYFFKGSAESEPSVLSYRILLTIDPTGQQRMRSGAVTACDPRM
jgi:hypothetical protein